MLSSEQSKNVHDLYTENSDRSVMQEEFYSPLCRSGYLTPLQRKKLREKRNLDESECSGDLDFRKFKKIKRSPIPNSKKDDNTSKRNKKKLISHKKITVSVPQVQCTVAKIFNKTVDSGDNDRKRFFKTSPSSRLGKASFTMPLVLKKNTFTSLDKNIKGVTISQRKISSPEEQESVSQNDNVISYEHENYVSPCIIKIVSNSVNSDTTSDNVQKHLDSTSSLDPSNSRDVDAVHVTEDTLFDFEWPSDDILLQRQENARTLKRESILKELNTMQKKKMDDNLNTSSETIAPVKLYPIFDFVNVKFQSSNNIKRNDKSSVKCVKDSSKGGEQMIIDAGQREIGPKICNTCNMLYTIGQEEDEKLHSSYHTMFLINLKFPGWKEENVIGEYCDGRVIMICKKDRPWKLKKMEDVLLIANRDLGFLTAGFPTKPDVTFILFISNEKRVAGCVVAESISSGCKVLLADDDSKIKDLNSSKEKIWRIGNWYSSSESVPAICGVNRIWVSREHRRRKVASRMIDCLRCNFIHGHIVSIQELAFTDPSPDGREFAAAYTGTNHFLVYK